MSSFLASLILVLTLIVFVFSGNNVVPSVDSSVKEGANQAFTIVGSEDGEFMVVAANSSMGEMSHIENVDSELSNTEGNTITLNLDEATQFLLRQQGITQAVELADGSFQIIDNPVEPVSSSG